MHKTHYRITFINGDTLDKWAFHQDEAVILAQAAQINAGRDYRVKSIGVIRDFANFE